MVGAGFTFMYLFVPLCTSFVLQYTCVGVILMLSCMHPLNEPRCSSLCVFVSYVRRLAAAIKDDSYTAS